MKRVLYTIIATLIGAGFADAAVRNTNSTARATSGSTSRMATIRKTVSRAAVNNKQNANTISRSTRLYNTHPTNSTVRTPKVSARSTTIGRSATDSVSTNTFDSGYNVCRDAYFTCMDQFCATQNDTYRRCVCSSRLSEIQTRENVLSQTADSIQDFKDLNIDIIPKTAAEVKAMLSASEGEAKLERTKDKSDAAQKLAGINAVLKATKSKSLSTSGTLDIGGDVNAIWATTELTSGENLANLTGETLYNAVNSQCSSFVAAQCPSQSILNMVISAYGMYIENDCSLLASGLDKKKSAANATIRETEREMNSARLDNYDAHNSTSINDCIANIRSDITNDAACGADYVHCLDVTGLYLNRTTGAPIYTPNFYKLENQISLSGNVLTNQANRLLVSELNNKKNFATNSLDTCRDLSDDIWDEFMRQAIVEIYQGQQDKIRQVKNDCLNAVNTCYNEQANSLKDFSNIDTNLLLGSTLELSEEMCIDKLNTCSNLYGGGDQGLQELITAMHKITDQNIESACEENLATYIRNVCSVVSTDTIHGYPYGCRVYTPGDRRCLIDKHSEGCEEYDNSLYAKLVKYSQQVCIRESISEQSDDDLTVISDNVFQDISRVMNSIRTDMSLELAKECERLGGEWDATPSKKIIDEVNTDNKPNDAFTKFYDATGANAQWGVCKNKTTSSESSESD